MGPDAGGAVALGWRSHSGWAVLVGVGGSPTAPVVVCRTRVELLDGSLPRQPFHAAAEDGLSLDEGATVISQVALAATLAATAAVQSAVVTLSESGHRVSGIGLVAGDRRIPGELSRILASHALLHAAEGELFEHAVHEGSARAGFPVVRVESKTVFESAATSTSMTVEDLNSALMSAGRLVGPPWQKDHREAAAAALVALKVSPFA